MDFCIPLCVCVPVFSDISYSHPSKNGIAGDKYISILRLSPRGGTLIFSYIRRLGPFFFVQNFEFQYFLGVSEK